MIFTNMRHSSSEGRSTCPRASFIWDHIKSLVSHDWLLSAVFIGREHNVACLHQERVPQWVGVWGGKEIDHLSQTLEQELRMPAKTWKNLSFVNIHSEWNIKVWVIHGVRQNGALSPVWMCSSKGLWGCCELLWKWVKVVVSVRVGEWRDGAVKCLSQ